jgi:thiosulfate reductase/polysulfide reductase chain A
MKATGIVRGAKQPVFFDEGVPAEFPTPSGKIEFYSTQLQALGHDPVPKYTPPAPTPPGSFRMLFGRSPVHSFGRTQTNPVLAEMMDENEVWVNADVARRLGVADGSRVRLRNQDGVTSLPVKVKATERIRPDCVYLVHGFGHNAKRLTRAFNKGASDAQLVTRYATDPLMGGTGMHVNFVSLVLES